MTMDVSTDGNNHHNIWAIIPAAGSGERFSDKPGLQRDKLMMTVGRIPILVRSVENILNTPKITGAVVVLKKEQEMLYRRALDQYGHVKPIRFAEGGTSRQESVRNGLAALPDNTKVVVIHDAARPLVSKKLTTALLDTLQKHSDWAGCIPGLPVTDTIKTMITDNGSQIVQETIDRNLLWRVQTPQVFNKAALLSACEAVPTETPYTDEAQLIELANTGKVGMIQGQSFNLKITHPDDLTAAESLYTQVKTQL